MIVRVVDSGSSGNCYIIQTGQEQLVIDCGVKKGRFLKAIDFDVKNVKGCLISHEHSDHSGAVKDFCKYGFPVMATSEVWEHLYRIYRAPIRKIQRNAPVKAGGFVIVPFQVPHNETECDGFYIRHVDFGSLLYITDAEMCPYNMSSLHVNHVLVECNYDERYVDINEPKAAHVLKGHMSLNTCKNFIESVKTDDLKSVGLIHLSKENSVPDEFVETIRQVFAGTVWVAKSNTTIEFEL